MNLSTISKLSEDEARDLFEKIRWPEGPSCPHCTAIGGIKLNWRKDNPEKPRKSAKHRPGLYKCEAEGCEKQFSATINTVLEDSHLPIRTWLMAFAILCDSKKGVSALQLQRQLGLGSYRSAWHLCHRIRHAMGKDPIATLLKGNVTVDETYVGGKPRRGSPRRKTGRGTPKTPVVALVERDGRVRAQTVKRMNMAGMHKLIRTNVDPSATIMTDEALFYNNIGDHFAGGHHTVNHARHEYVRGDISTNDAESFFALLKRGVIGSFHHISKQHIDKYCDEFAFRWNRRKENGTIIFQDAIKGGEGKRLMYKTPIKH